MTHWLLLAPLAFAVAACLRGRWLVVTVRGQSMAPTLADGQRLLARRSRGRPCAVGELAVFRLTDAQLRRDGSEELPLRIKRVAAVAGEPLPEWLRASPLGASPDGRVPAGHVVVMGDNPRSEDSRHLGFIPQRAILAVIRNRPAAPRGAGEAPFA